MKAAPAYLLAVLIASIVMGQELALVGWVHSWFTGMNLDSLWIGLLATAIFGTPFIMIAALMISFLPIMIFYPVYVWLPEQLRLPVSMVFGSLVAFAGLTLTLGLLDSTLGRGDIGMFMLLSLLPGLTGGWMFHKVLSLPDSLAEPVVEDEAQKQVS